MYSANVTTSQNNTNLLKGCEIYSKSFKIVTSSLLGLTTFVSLLENLLLCLIIYWNKQLQKRSSVLIVNLALIDIVIALTLPWLEIVKIVEFPDWPLGNVGDYVLNGSWVFSMVASFSTITAIAVERYIAIVCGIKYNLIVNKRFLTFVLTLIWGYSLIWSVGMAFVSDPIEKSQRHKSYWNVDNKLYSAFLGINLLIPLITIPILYLRMFQTFTRLRQKLHNKPTDNVNKVTVTKAEEGSNAEMNLAKSFVYISVILYTVWIPVAIFESLFTYLDDCWAKQICSLSVWLSCLNGCVNPFIYSYRSSKMKNAIRKYFEKGRKIFERQSSYSYQTQCNED